MRTTNVKPEQLNYYGYSSAKYEDGIARAIPSHRELHDSLAGALLRKFSVTEKIKVLELGVGTGITTERIRSCFSTAHIDAVDFSDTMLAGAKKKLGTRRIHYILADYSVRQFRKKYDLVVSVVGIHHQTTKGKKALFRKIHEWLKPEGVFAFGDLVTYRDQKVAALNHARHYHHLVENAKDEATLTEWAHHHMFLNNLAPIEDQIEWLEGIGFKVTTEFLKINTALLIGEK